MGSGKLTNSSVGSSPKIVWSQMGHATKHSSLSGIMPTRKKRKKLLDHNALKAVTAACVGPCSTATAISSLLWLSTKVETTGW